MEVKIKSSPCPIPSRVNPGIYGVHGTKIEGRIIDTTTIDKFSWYKKPVVILEFPGAGIRTQLARPRYESSPFVTPHVHKYFSAYYPSNLGDKIEQLVANRVSVITQINLELVEELHRRNIHQVLVYPSYMCDRDVWRQRMVDIGTASRLRDEYYLGWDFLLKEFHECSLGTHVMLDDNDQTPALEFFTQ